MLGRIMQRMARIFRTAFRSPVSDPEIRDHEQVKREIARDVVSKTPTGNVNLQQGRYLTKEDMDRIRESVKDYKVDHVGQGKSRYRLIPGLTATLRQGRGRHQRS